MNNIERGWCDVLRRWPKSKMVKALRDDWGMFAMHVLLDGQLGCFSVKVSKKAPLEASKRGVFLSCHANMCDQKMPIFILHDGVVWRIKPMRITSAYAFRNWLHGALMLNFYTPDVDAEVIGRIDGRTLCVDCGGSVADTNVVRCVTCTVVRCVTCTKEVAHE